MVTFPKIYQETYCMVCWLLGNVAWRFYGNCSLLTAKSEEMCQMSNDRGCPDFAVNEGLERTHQIDQQTALDTLQRSREGRSPFTLTHHLNNDAAKNTDN